MRRASGARGAETALRQRVCSSVRERCQVVIVSGLFCLLWSVAAARAQPLEPGLDDSLMARAFERAEALPRLHALIVARHGRIAAERRFRGPALDAPVNVKSISKSIVSALVGIAIAEGALTGVEQSIARFFPEYLKRGAGPRLHEITIGDLLSMRSGLARTSGESYGPWVRSRNWVEHILRQPLIAEPGSTMIYSTGNSHLLSAILTRATRRSTFAYARDRLAKPLGIELPRWERDPQGVYIGGNQMRLSAHALVRFGELYRNFGRVGTRQVIPASWIEASLTPRARSIFSGQLYGYGWFISELAGHSAYFAWGYGGQFIFVVPALALTMVTTSAADGPRDFEHLSAIMELLRDYIVPAAESADASVRG
jgi:CubicO group peptidase (beta-lactamase class C family)